MPRGIKKTINYEEEFAVIDNKISFHTNHIKQLKEKKETLIQEQQKKYLNSILDIMQDLDLEAVDVIEILKSQKKEKVS
jgi:hypothetical protein